MKSSQKNKNHPLEEDLMEMLHRPPSPYQDSYIDLASGRCIFLNEVFTKRTSAEMTAWLLYYDHLDPKVPINIYINSDGGDGAALTNIYDIMQHIKAPIHTICVGKCYSAGAFILAAGTHGKRYIYPHGQVMIHGIQANALSLGDDQNNAQTYYDFLTTYNNRILSLLAKHTRQPLDKIKEDCKRDLYFDAKQAVKYGLADYVLV